VSRFFTSLMIPGSRRPFDQCESHENRPVHDAHTVCVFIWPSRSPSNAAARRSSSLPFRRRTNIAQIQIREDRGHSPGSVSQWLTLTWLSGINRKRFVGERERIMQMCSVHNLSRDRRVSEVQERPLSEPYTTQHCGRTESNWKVADRISHPSGFSP
jgi:hypothetical protein